LRNGLLGKLIGHAWSLDEDKETKNFLIELFSDAGKKQKE
jgi:hypothetical protein